MAATRPRSAPRTGADPVIGAAFGAFVLIIWLADWWRLITWRATAMDFGWYTQALWLIAHGRGPDPVTLLGWPALADSGSYVLYPMAPVYALSGQAGMLLVQALSLASGVFGVNWLAARAGLGPAARRAWSLIYLTFPGVLAVATFDWHPDVFFIPAFFLAVWGTETRRLLPFTAGILLAALTKITGAGLVAVLAASLVLRRQWGYAFLALVVGAGTAALDLWWVFPRLYPHGLSNWGILYGWIGPTPARAFIRLARNPGLVLQALGRPQALILLAFWLAPQGLIPPVTGGIRTAYGLPALALWVFNGLSGFGPQLSPFNQYSLPAVPFLFASALLASRLFRRGPPAAALAAAAVALSALTYGGLDAPGLFRPQPHAATLAAAAARIPRQAPLIGLNRSLAPLAGRPYVYLLSARSLRQARPGTYILVNLDARRNQLTSPARIAALARPLLRNPDWQVLMDRHGILLLRRRP